MSTSEGLRSFVAPVTEVEMKTGGHYYTNYNPAARIGDPGTIYNTVLAYVPLEMVAIHVKLGTQIFPASVADADQLSAIMQIQDAGQRQRARLRDHDRLAERRGLGQGLQVLPDRQRLRAGAAL